MKPVVQATATELPTIDLMEYPARILVVGNGARENALANALLSSAQVERLWITPPNWGVLDPHFPDGRRYGPGHPPLCDRRRDVVQSSHWRTGERSSGP